MQEWRLETFGLRSQAVVLPCRSDRSTYGLSPYGHLADGRCALILVHACSPLEYLRFMASIPGGGKAVVVARCPRADRGT
jgi:hypothetical protein